MDQESEIITHYMYTAYCIHTSEGTPIRRIIQTETAGNGTMKITTTDCDWDWNRKNKVQSFTMPAPGKSLLVVGGQSTYHQMFRKKMQQEHGWRFEIYWPLSSLAV
jgi:hypothetical protein